VTIASEAIERVVRANDYISRAVRGQDGDQVVEYGITTGFGEFKDVHIGLSQVIELQRNLILSHATGVGLTCDADDPSNYFPAEVVRAALLLRLNAFLRGNSGVSHTLLAVIRAMLNRGVVPLVPLRGSVGSSGDLAPLAHLFLVLLGRGHFYLAPSAAEVASSRPVEIYPGDQLSDKLGLGLDRDLVGPKAGLALINGAAFAAATLALGIHDAEMLADAADVALGLTLEGICGSVTPFHPAVHRARPFHGQITTARHVRALVEGSRLVGTAPSVQDAYSVRCGPQIHGASRDAITYARRVIDIEINASTDNPLIFLDEVHPEPGHLTFSAGNFHGQPLAIAADLLGIAAAELANVAERRTQMLLDQHHNRNLPPNLTVNPGLNSGMMITQYAAASLVSENKILAHPASVDSIPTSANSEDHVSMATVAARKARMIVSNAQATVAIELMAAAQAIDWRILVGRRPHAGVNGTEPSAAAILRSSQDRVSTTSEYMAPGTRDAYRHIRTVVPTLVEDRPMDADIRAIWQLIRTGVLTHCLHRLLSTEKAEYGGETDND
jgi:histidine ammonia-lyase